jgi:hypothetical protein
VVVVRVELDGAKELGDVELFAVTDVLLQRCVHGIAFGSMTANALGFDEEFVIDAEVRSHVILHNTLHNALCKAACQFAGLGLGFG